MDDHICASNYSANISLDSGPPPPPPPTVYVQEVVQGGYGMESYWAYAGGESPCEH